MNLHMNNSQKIFRILMTAFMIVCVMFTVTPVRPAYAATFTVNSVGDSSDADLLDGLCDADPTPVVECTLRAAIEQANDAADLDTINFVTPLTITLASPLPTITENVTIDATGSTVDVDMSGIGADDGFDITANNVIIRGFEIYAGGGAWDGIYVNGATNVTIENMIIHGFGEYGIEIVGGATNVLVDSNYIGVQADGSTADANGFSGVRIINSPTNSITNNVISGNNSFGIYITGAASDGNTIKGNYIGLNSAGTTTVSNIATGIYLSDAPNTQVGGTAVADRNYISGNGGDGVFVSGASNGTVIQGNYIGTNSIGENARPNTAFGVRLSNTTSITIGGGSAAAGNLISGNNNDGVYVLNAPAANTVQNNTIGLDVDGDTDLGNLGNGILLSNSINTIVSNNTISKNTLSGVLITGGSTGSDLQSNRIGISRTGSLSLGNSIDGVEIVDSPDNVINNNTIAYNTGDGVSMTGVTSTANTITSNSIFSNGGLGIDLNDNGVTANDGAGDADVGPNTYQNFPVITSSAIEGSGVRVIGYLESGPYASRGNYDLQFFHQTTCDGSGYGEGRTLMNTTAISLPGLPDPAPNRYDFNILIDPFSASVGDFITATATYDNGTSLEDTSEFSPCATIPPSTSVFVVNSTLDTPEGAPGDGSCDVGGGVCTLRAAIQEVNAGAAPPYTIAFNIGGSFTITLGSSLPTITNQVTIDGSSQPGYVSSPIIMVDGNASAANGFVFSASSCELRGLSIVGFTAFGAYINPGISGTTIEDNYIGLQTDGTTSDGNSTGVYVSGGVSNLILDNVISANQYGIQLVGSAAQANVLQGNYIGTDAGGTLDRGNTLDGIQVAGGQNNIIGGTGGGQRNVISGNNSDGIELNGGGTGGNLIYGNYIGVQMDGTSSLGNSGYGIRIDSIPDNFVSNGNVIANNGAGGVYVTNVVSVGNLISQNSIHSNTGSGIALAASGNNSQAPPTLTSAETSSGIGYTRVGGTLNAVDGFLPLTTYTIEFFSNPIGETQGRTYEDSTTVQTDGAGNLIFSYDIPIELGIGTDRVTATATDGNNNTSEFDVGAPVTLGVLLPTQTPTSTATATSTSTPTASNTSAPTNTTAPTNTSGGGGATNTSAPTNTPSPTGPTSTFTLVPQYYTLTAMAAEDTLIASGATVTGTPPTATPWWLSSETPSPGGSTETPDANGEGGGGVDTDTPTPTPTETPGISDSDATATAQAAAAEEEGGGMSSFLWILIIIALLILFAGGAMELIRWLNSREA